MELPNRVLVKFRVNLNRAAELRAAGLYQVNRTVVQDIELRRRQRSEAEGIGRDAFRGGRTDATGTVRPDSGTPMFTWDPKGRADVCLKGAICDLRRNLGMKLTQVNLLQKPNDHMAFLVLKFERVEGDEVELNETQQRLVDAMVERTYEHLHGYRNPDHSWTFNAAHAQMNECAVRDVTIDGEGHVNCVPRN